MSKRDENIFPVHDQVLQKDFKEKILNQRAKAIWLTGLSGSGKTTLAIGLEQELFKKGYFAKVLDGDNIRSGINNNLRFTEEDRKENIRRIAEVSKLFNDCGIITINGLISPTEEIRELARKIIGEENFIEIFVNSSLEVCESRDKKGLYAKARKGELKNFTGVDSPFEVPASADLEIKTDTLTKEESLELALEYILPKVEYKED
jgi:adenylylsulfate kinase